VTNGADGHADHGRNGIPQPSCTSDVISDPCSLALVFPLAVTGQSEVHALGTAEETFSGP